MEFIVKQPGIDDAFGRVLVRCWEAGAAPWSAVEVIERDDALISANDAARYFSEPAQWSALDRWAWEQAEGRVLDVGCGAGRHAVAWGARGYDVVGVDPSPGAVRITRERGITAVVGSVPSLPEGLGQFDTIALCGDSLGLLGGPDQASRVLSALAAVARPGARLVGTGTDPGMALGRSTRATTPSISAGGERAVNCASAYGMGPWPRRGSTTGWRRRTSSWRPWRGQRGPWSRWSAIPPALGGR
ncbi:class I SAM-dependent methyltransferase [Streptomyces sp. NPDC050085]|uniref:class I SAM-dependent methyltransferase n=1 Tax=Streptomyces sp. NPDC050085 TaxID=3365600 RepID=UPI0037BA5265